MDIRSKPIDNLNADTTWKDTVVEQCLCGSREFYIVARFHNSDISGWFTEAICFNCNSWVKVPTPVDHAGVPL